MTYKKGDTGEQITAWQAFLAGQGFYSGGYDPVFGPNTEAATIKFQSANHLTADGIAGPATLARAAALGYAAPAEPDHSNEPGYMDASWPPPLDADMDGKPDLIYPNDAWRQATFGKFAYKASPSADNAERIVITDNWVAENIVSVEVPLLKGVSGFPSGGKVQFHKKVAPQFVKMTEAWKEAGVLSFFKSWAGSFYPRFIRGSTTTLSNHSYGAAFDCNVPWNGLGVVPALVGQVGTVRPLVTIAEKHGFYWGGRYNGRKDGMHFECIRII